MADTHSSNAVSCGTTACITDELMALGVFGWMISVIFILIFMVLMTAEHMKTQQYLTLVYLKFSQYITDKQYQVSCI
jgi:hypothetical protein